MADKVISGEQHQAMISTRPGAPKSYGQPRDNRPWLVVLVVVLMALSFLGGTLYQKGQHLTSSPTGRGGFGNFLRGRGGGLGQVSAVSPSSITIDSRSGSQRTFSISSSTNIESNGQTAGLSSIAVGDTVLVVPSQANPSQAATIILNPSFGGGGLSPGSSNPSGTVE